MSDLTAYDYDLPRELIAQHPPPRRGDSRLLVVDRAGAPLRHGHVRDLAEYLRRGDCLVINDSRVVPARLVGKRTATGGRFEGLFLSSSPEGWRMLAKTRGKLVEGEAIILEDHHGRAAFRLALLAKHAGGEWTAMPLAEGETLALLDRVGRVPLPPYIRRGEMSPEDVDRYQTVYADRPGSVAAPTAGLHLTESLIEGLTAGGVRIARLTLHVGPGTFRPIKTSLDAHPMHAEWGELSRDAADAINAAREGGGRVVAVGTTSVRVLETAALDGDATPWRGETRLFIRPGHAFRAVDALLTNFHLPRSTLLVLVRTFGGDQRIRDAYDEAIRERYRFYSYGDAMLIV